MRVLEGRSGVISRNGSKAAAGSSALGRKQTFAIPPTTQRRRALAPAAPPSIGVFPRPSVTWLPPRRPGRGATLPGQPVTNPSTSLLFPVPKEQAGSANFTS